MPWPTVPVPIPPAGQGVSVQDLLRYVVELSHCVFDLQALVRGRLSLGTDPWGGLPGQNVDTAVVDVGYYPEVAADYDVWINNPLDREPVGVVPICWGGNIPGVSVGLYLAVGHMMYETSITNAGLSLVQNSTTVSRTGTGRSFSSKMDKGYVMPTGASTLAAASSRMKITAIKDADELSLQDPWPFASESDIQGLIIYHWDADGFYISTPAVPTYLRLLVF